MHSLCKHLPRYENALKNIVLKDQSKEYTLFDLSALNKYLPKSLRLGFRQIAFLVRAQRIFKVTKRFVLGRMRYRFSLIK